MEQLPLWDSTPRSNERRTIPLLSKSRFGAGLQCHKRLYLECYRKELAEPPGATTLALFESGRQVGMVARGRYKGGVVIADEARRHDDAVRSTRLALARSGTSAIFEAAFTYDDLRVRVDIIAAAQDGAWDLVEVKSSSGYKEEYLPDVGIQLYALEGSGVRIRGVYLLHVNSQYVWEGGPYDLERLFMLRDLTEPARAVRPDLLAQLEAMRAPLWGSDPPMVAVGHHCKKPYVCPFYDHCHSGGPLHPLEHLPRVSPALLRALRDADIADIRDIPEDFDGLTDLHRRIRVSVITGRVHSDPELKQVLNGLEPPIHFLDFETCNPALPLFVGTQPFQQVPFEWSLHSLEPDGKLHHREYLHTAGGDPRRPVARSLLEALGDRGPIVVYSGFEERIIRSLADDLGDLRERLLRVADSRLVDLLELIRTHYYHPRFKGSFSIKGVLPALIEDLDYDDLEIQEGGQAANAFVEMVRGRTSQARRQSLEEALRAYCRRDTEAMVRLFQKLKEDG